MTTIDTINDMKPEWPVTVGTAREADLADDATTTTLSSGRTPLSKVDTAVTVDEINPLDVVGSTNIYDDRGNIRLIPVGLTPTRLAPHHNVTLNLAAMI